MKMGNPQLSSARVWHLETLTAQAEALEPDFLAKHLAMKISQESLPVCRADSAKTHLEYI